MVFGLILLLIIQVQSYAVTSCNHHFQDHQAIANYISEGFGRIHRYEVTQASGDWTFLPSTPKAYVNQQEVAPHFSHPEFKDVQGNGIEISEINGEEIIARSSLPSNHPNYIDPSNIGGEGFYHGDDIEPQMILSSGGFKTSEDVQIIDRDLIHHASGEDNISRYAQDTPLAGVKVKSAFMGSTSTPLSLNRNEEPWGKYIYDFRGVPGWDLQATQHLVKTDVERAILRGVSGEREIVIPRDIPIWCLLRVATTSTSSVSGRTRISRWNLNSEYNPELCRKYFAR